jgi:putative ABC transport system permease protein
MRESGFGWTAALRIAWREARSSPARFAFVILAVAAGVGALTGVRSFSESFRAILLKEARTLMAGDLLVRSFDAPTAEQLAVLERLQGRGVALTRITETLSMMSSGKVTAPLLVSVKAVDPAVYPFYGEVRLEPPTPLAAALTADTIGVSEDLLVRLDTGVGDLVRLGKAQFRIAAIVRLEPDRMTGSLNVGPRVMITREGLDRTELMQQGSRASRRYLLRLPAGGPGVDEVRRELVRVFPGTLVTDFREVHPRIQRGLSRATTFLSLVGLIALIVGAVGVGMAMHSHIEQRMDAIAVMKCLGGRSPQIIRIYLAQTLLLGVAGSALGVLFGVGVQAGFPHFIARYFPLRPERIIDLSAAAQGLAAGVLTTLLFTLPPLLRIREVRPAVIFRREMAEAKRTLRERWFRARGALLAGGAVLLGIGLTAAWLAGGSWREMLRTSLTFLGGITASVAVLGAVSWALLGGLRWVSRQAPRGLPPLVRHGVANLFRPGNHAQTVLVALGVGVTFTLTVYLLQHGLAAELARSAPKDMPNVFLINITADQQEGLLELLRRQEGIESEPRIVASARARIVAVDSAPVASLKLEGRLGRYRREQTVVGMAGQPREVRVTAGSWWSAPGAEPRMCVSEEVAGALNLRPGSRMEWTTGGIAWSARVACVHRQVEERFGPDLDFVFDETVLARMPVTYFGGLRMRPGSVAALQRAAYVHYPTVTVINTAEVLIIVQEVVDQVAVVVRFVAAFAILAGAIILASSVAGTRFRRIREAAILKTLGATRRRVIAVFSIEFLILGSVAGLTGSLLASGFSRVLLTRMLDAPFRFDWPANLAAVALTALLAVGAGWLASYRILGQKPLEVLRSE